MNTHEVPKSLAKVAEVQYNGLGIALMYDFHYRDVVLLTRGLRSGLTRYRPSNVPAPDFSPVNFTQAVEQGTSYLQANKHLIWGADHSRVDENGWAEVA